MVGLAVVFVFSFVAGGEEEGGSEEESLFRAPIVGGVVKGCFFCFAGCTSAWGIVGFGRERKVRV